MKSVLLVVLFFSSAVFGAELNLTSGESAVIQANVNTRVTCGGGSSSNPGCGDHIQGLKTLLQACKESFSGSYCIDKYWPTFKANAPQCTLAALSICIDYCKESFSASYCADKCSK
ncbi:MAG: hypothetical protein V4736_05240 [Bdellovibrionota bacterium]